MSSELYIFILILAALYGYFLFEARAHEKNLNKLPLRIHVNGTRGKSSVTRLIAAGLRAGGYQVFAKTTGTEAKLIYPDGHEEFVKRRSPANIKENISIIKEAVKSQANALVIECMAIQPELQWFCENRLIQSHIGVITNIRADHEDVMGNGLENVALALSNTIPNAGRLVTTADAASLLKKIGLKEQQPIIEAEEKSFPSPFYQDFEYQVIPDNVALALKVCELAGVDKIVAVAGMRNAVPDAGNLTMRDIRIANKHISFINALAANDPESTLWLWRKFVPNGSTAVVLLNCRVDRRFRTVQLCQTMTKVHCGRYVLAGDSTFALSILLKEGIAKENIYVLPKEACFEDVNCYIRKCPEEQFVLFAAGNVKGAEKLLEL